MTLRDLIHKIMQTPDWISDIDDDPTQPKNHIETSDGRILTDLWVNGNDKIIIELEKEENDDQ